MEEQRFFCVSCVAPFQFSFLSFLCWSPIRTCSLIILCSFVRGLVPDPWVTFVGHFRGSLFVDVVGHFWSLIVVLVVAAVVVVAEEEPAPSYFLESGIAQTTAKAPVWKRSQLLQFL